MSVPLGEINLGVIAFGGQGVVLHQRPVPAASATGVDMEAVGGPDGTPIGEAFEMARRILDDEETIPARAYDVTLVLISDGRPTSEWRPQLDRLLSSEHGARSLRLAVERAQREDPQTGGADRCRGPAGQVGGRTTLRPGRNPDRAALVTAGW
ncbi:vWA domain-containing protein [Actinomadura pelletieri]|uniref:vWA domain-containing protein n=1 Tax=Actinomadura pelletieri TaxID=111805 RepID=UPI0011C45DAC|nr:hypothetical protein [Actinomadura pelletieri]